MFQDWLYEDGEDASKAQYIAKMDEIRAMAGPIVQRHFDKVEADRQALQAKLDAEAAAKKAAAEEERKAKEDAEASLATFRAETQAKLDNLQAGIDEKSRILQETEASMNSERDAKEAAEQSLAVFRTETQTKLEQLEKSVQEFVGAKSACANLYMLTYNTLS